MSLENVPSRLERNPVVELAARYGRPHARYFGLGFATSVLARFPQLLPALLVGIAIDAIFLESAPYALPLVPASWLPTTTEGQFLLTVALLVLAFPLNTALAAVASLSLGVFGERLQHDVRVDTYDRVQRLEMNVFDETETGRVMSVLNDDVRQLQAFVGASIGAVQIVTLAAVVYLYLFWLNWQLATSLVVVPVVLLGMSRWFSSIIEPRHLAVRESVGTINDRLNNNIGGISVIKSSGTEDLEAERVEAASREYHDTQWNLVTARAAFGPSMESFASGSRALVLAIGGYWVLVGPPLFFTGTLTPGALFTFVAYVTRFVEPLKNLEHVVDGYQNGKAAARRIVDLTDGETVSVPDDATELDAETVAGSVAYEDVTFTYPSRDEPAVRDVSFAVKPGETVGVVGPTGSGKSTLLKLLFRFYDPDRGTIRVDGHDVRDLDLESLRESIGYVSQDPFLFSGTVLENVRYARPNVDREDVVRAAKLAGAHEFVVDLPNGYDTAVGERGVTLSGGQRQRLALARALVDEPRLLVLDEATSHVDNETEVLIQRALEDVTGRQTTFLIAHRLSTVRDADRILVIDDGRLVEHGTHDELLENDGLYANLWRTQVGDVDALPEAFLERLRRQERGEREVER